MLIFIDMNSVYDRSSLASISKCRQSFFQIDAGRRHSSQHCGPRIAAQTFLQDKQQLINKNFPPDRKIVIDIYSTVFYIINKNKITIGSANKIILQFY